MTLLVGVLGVGALYALPSLLPSATQANGKGIERADGEGRDAPDLSSPEVDWSWLSSPALLITVGVVAGLASVITMSAVVVRRRRTTAKRNAAEEARLDRIWTESVERHDRVRDAWMGYQSDIGEILAKPTLSDLNDPHVVRLVDALGTAADLATATRPSSAAAAERYAKATRAVEQAWRRASAHAELVRLAGFDDGEQDRIRRAERLLAQARSGAAAPAERRTYYRHATKLLDGLIRIPEPAREALEAVTHPELEIADHPRAGGAARAWVLDRGREAGRRASYAASRRM